MPAQAAGLELQLDAESGASRAAAGCTRLIGGFPLSVELLSFFQNWLAQNGLARPR